MVSAPGPKVHVCPENVCSVQGSVHVAEPLSSCIIDLPSLEGLSEQEAEQVKQLLNKYQVVFSTVEGDIGCTALIKHEIPLVDDRPVRQPYRRIPPSQYESVRSHIQQLLDSRVIRESSSPLVPNCSSAEEGWNN